MQSVFLSLCDRSVGCCSYSLAQFTTSDCLRVHLRLPDHLRIEHEDLLYLGATSGDDTYNDIFLNSSHQEVIGGPTIESQAPDSDISELSRQPNQCVLHPILLICSNTDNPTFQTFCIHVYTFNAVRYGFIDLNRPMLNTFALLLL